MSQILIASPKHCANQGGGVLVIHVRKLNRRLLCALSTFFLAALSVVLLVWLILHPSKPQFDLKDADVDQLSLPSPRLLNATLRFTLVSKNPNDRVGVYYDRLRAYASYEGQQITAQAAIPPFYQGHGDSNVLSASLSGAGVPVAASLGYEVGRDQTAGRLPIRLKLEGRLRWKVGTWLSGWYPIVVDCAAVVGFAPGSDLSRQLSSNAQGSRCSTTV